MKFSLFFIWNLEFSIFKPGKMLLLETDYERKAKK